MKTIKVPLEKLSKNVKELSFIGNDEKIKTTDLYFKKITMADLTEEEADKYFDLSDKIKDRFRKALLEELSRQKTENENIEQNNNDTKTEEEFENILSMSIVLQGIGLRTNDIRKEVKPLLKKFVFLNEEMTESLGTIAQKQLDMDIVNVMYFLLATSLSL